MEINASNSIYGLSEGIAYGQFGRVDELNDRMFSRYFSDVALEPNYDPRPVPTKYSHFPIVDRRVPATVKPSVFLNYHVELNFNPGTRNAPVSGYFANIDTETILRNQAFALNHGADQSVYIPSSKSDLYNVSVVHRPSEQPYPGLFEQPQFQTTGTRNTSSSLQIGADRFNNHTRTQLRGTTGL
jgi:hypothetical protein